MMSEQGRGTHYNKNTQIVALTCEGWCQNYLVDKKSFLDGAYFNSYMLVLTNSTSIKVEKLDLCLSNISGDLCKKVMANNQGIDFGYHAQKMLVSIL